MKNIAVYTAIINKYDNLSGVRGAGNADYICFSDEEIRAPHPWQLRVQERPHPDPRYASRYYFDQSTLVLPEYEYTIMHSGNATLRVDPEDLLKYVKDTDIASFEHPRRDSVFKEYQIIITHGKDTRENMLPQLNRYRNEGFQQKHLSACTLLIRRNTPAIKEFEKQWWHEVKNGSHRDQLSFDYVRWKLNVPITYIPGDVFHTKIMWRRRGVFKYPKTL